MDAIYNALSPFTTGRLVAHHCVIVMAYRVFIAPAHFATHHYGQRHRQSYPLSRYWRISLCHIPLSCHGRLYMDPEIPQLTQLILQDVTSQNIPLLHNRSTN